MPKFKPKKAFVASLLAVFSMFFLQIGFPIGEAWSNGGPSYPGWVQYGTHDLIADSAYYRVLEVDPDAVKYLAEDLWDYRYATEIPDFKLQDWVNHNYDFHKYGYKGGPPDRGAPSKVQELYDETVELLSNWITEGMPVGSQNAKEARKSMGMVSHYFADICMPLHTDDTSDGSPEHTHTTLKFPDGSIKKKSYHSLYESSIDYGVKQRIIDLYSIPKVRRPTYINDPYALTLEYAKLSNGIYVVPATDPEHCLVGNRYWWFVEEIEGCVDHEKTFNGLPGMSPELYRETMVQLQYASEGFADILYSVWQDAEEQAEYQIVEPYPLAS